MSFNESCFVHILSVQSENENVLRIRTDSDTTFYDVIRTEFFVSYVQSVFVTWSHDLLSYPLPLGVANQLFLLIFVRISVADCMHTFDYCWK